MWSFFFVILEFLDQPLIWKQNTNKDEVRDLKRKAFKNPKQLLFPNLYKDHPEIVEIFSHLKKLEYESAPDYNLIRQKLSSIK